MTNPATDDAAVTPRAAYPLPRPAGTGPQITYGLLHDIAEALQHNGFPRPAGTDWADLSLALHQFLYQEMTP